MEQTSRLAIAAVTIGLLAANAAANTNIVINGSFEDAQQAGPTRVAITNLTDWTSFGGSNLLEQGVNSTSLIEAQDGNQFVSLGHNGQSGSRLEQDLPTVPGQRYDVTFWMRAIQGGSTPSLQELQVSANDTSTVLVVLTAQVTDATQWGRAGFGFTATSALTTLRFSDTVGGSSANIAVDNVSVIGCMIPEPTSLMMVVMMGVGLTSCRGRVR